MDFPIIRRHCANTAKQLFEEFDKRKGTWADAAREFYPIGLAGLTKSVEDLSDDYAVADSGKLYTLVPVDCLRKGASGFHGNLTSPARRWFRFRLPTFMTENGETTHGQRQALDRLTEATEWVFSRGGVYAPLEKLYEHLLCFGFAAMIVSSDPEKIVKAQTLRVGTYALGIGDDGMVCRLVRRFSFTAEQVIEAFGDSGVSDDIKQAATAGNHKRRWTVYNLIEPNAVGDLKAYDRVAQELNLSEEMIYRSVYWLEKATDEVPQSGVLSICGFSIKPIVAPRLDYELGDTYGRGRGVDGIPLARGLQTFKADILRASGNRVQPAVVASAEFKDKGLKLGRGQVNYTRLGEQRNGMVAPVFPTPPDSSETREAFDAARLEIQDLFFNTAFAAIDSVKMQSGVKTATEIDAIVRENMERLGSVVTNLDKELLDPLVSIIANYTLQANVAPMSEDDLASFGGINVEYVSQIHLAQKQSSISAVQGWVAFVSQLGQFKPEAFDKLEVNGTVDKFGDMLGVPEQCVASDEQVAQAAQARQQAMERQAQMEEMQAGSKAMRDMGGIPVDEGHAAGLLAQGLGAGEA